MLLVI